MTITKLLLIIVCVGAMAGVATISGCANSAGSSSTSSGFLPRVSM